MKADKMMSEKKTNFSKARKVRQGIHIQPVTTNYHKKMTLLLKEMGAELHTLISNEGNSLKVVIRGLPQGIISSSALGA